MSDRGRFWVDRGLFDHEFFEGQEYSEREAWTYLIGKAAHASYIHREGKFTIKLERGQCLISIRKLAQKFIWNKSRVERFLKRLKAETWIETRSEARSETGMTVLTICKYERFQPRLSSAETPNETARETPTETQFKNNDLEEKKEDERGSARAREGAKKFLTDLAFVIFKNVAAIENRDPLECQAYPYAIQLLLNKGVRQDQIEEAVRRGMEKLKKPPRTFAYYEPIISQIQAEEQKPLQKHEATNGYKRTHSTGKIDGFDKLEWELEQQLAQRQYGGGSQVAYRASSPPLQVVHQRKD